MSDECGKISNVTKFSVLEDVETSERCGKQCGHERAWRGVYCFSAERCGINSGKVAGCLLPVCKGGGGVSKKCGNCSDVAKFSVLKDEGISE